jgi:signal transduction histidine kinase
MEAGQAQEIEAGAATLAKFILSRRGQILALWEGAVRRLPTAKGLPKPVLVDSVPQLLEAIARSIAERETGQTEIPPRLVERHALERMESGFDLAQVVAEYSLLRDAILELWERETLPPSERGSTRMLHQAIDQSISLSIERFTDEQIRAARALDRIATASLESHDLDDLLERLLVVVTETLPAVDTAAILLRTGDHLRVQAAVGLQREVELGFSLKIGEGFAGKIAAERRPVLLAFAAADPLVKSQVLRAKGVRALYGVPLIENGTLLGVAHVGSLTAYDLCEEDRRMVDSMASRATAAIYQQMLRRDAEQRATEAREAVRLRDQVLAIVSHDLRNPVGAVKLAAGLLLERARAEGERRQIKQLETIQRAASRMEHLIGDLLDMASIHVGKLKIQRCAQSAEALIQEAAEPCDAMAPALGLQFAVEQDVAGLFVDCDHQRILQVFSNLLGNAFKFCRRGDRIAVRAHRDGNEIRFEVADTGPGIPPEERPHVFEPYWSTDRHGKRGTGLGLFIARAVIDAHRGKLWVEGEPGDGTTFFFTLPIAASNILEPRARQ